jgi:peptidoglycan/xylan/chitin deacetylase (PgdA/CDA1 family)
MTPSDQTSARTPLLSSPIGPPRSEREARFRRRRAGAVMAAIALVVAIGTALLSGGSTAHPRVAVARSSAPSLFPLSRHRSAAAAGTQTLIGGITPAQSAAIDRALRYTNYISVGAGTRRDVALTFDDGPGPFTPEVLAVLQHERAAATFFQVGKSIHDYTSYAQAELGAGFPVEDHTMTHPLIARLSPADQTTEIVGTGQAMQAYGAPYPRLFRPPYGSFDTATLALLRQQDMLMVLWTIDTRDFSQPGVDAIVQSVLTGAKPGAIVLMHDAGGQRSQTVAALPLIIRGLRRRGFHLVTVPQLILDDPPVPGQSPPRNLSGQ